MFVTAVAEASVYLPHFFGRIVGSARQNFLYTRRYCLSTSVFEVFGHGLGQFHFYFLKFLDFEELNIKKFPWISKKNKVVLHTYIRKRIFSWKDSFQKSVKSNHLKGEKCFRFSKLIKYSQSFLFKVQVF